jgi:hypothetical protein
VIRAALIAAAACSCGAPPGAGPDDRGAGEPPLAFTDISAASPALAASPYGGGDSWDHSDKYAPGVALGDIDGDGILDLVQPRNDRDDPSLRGLALFRGLGDGRFEAAPAPSWDPRDLATAVLLFDVDGDRDLDLYVAVDGGPSRLYRNDGEWALTEIGAAAGADLPGVRAFTVAAADFDGDGDSDLYIGAWNASAPDHGPGSADNVLLENRGDGTFRDITAAAGAACDGRSTLGASFADLDVDGDADLYVANDYFEDCLLENRGDGTFVDVAPAAGVAGGALHGMGIASGDLDGDGDIDILVTDDNGADDSFGNPFYDNQGGLRFASRGVELGIDGLAALAADWLVCWGAGMIDFDLDGDLDLHVATHGGREELLWQQRGPLEMVSLPAAAAGIPDADARGTAYGDIDGDGDEDIVVARRGAGLQILRNDSSRGNWIRLVPRDPAAAAGATVFVTAGGRRRVAPLVAGDSYMSSRPLEVIIGLGDLEAAERIEVRFPDGEVARYDQVAADAVLDP